MEAFWILFGFGFFSYEEEIFYPCDKYLNKRKPLTKSPPEYPYPTIPLPTQ